MPKWTRVLPLFAALALFAAACAPPGPGNLSPTASFTATPTSGFAPLSVLFDASGSSDPDGSIVSYAWDFGDTGTGTGATTSYTYNAPGNYTVTLTVTDNLGATGTTTATIQVTTNPVQDNDGDGYFTPADCDDNDPTINPGAPDPVGDDIDQNCDGIDGVQNAAVFVNSVTGTDTSSCGDINDPCASISQGQSRALALSRSAVYVAGGTYGKFAVQPGLEIRGGYGQNWQRGLTATLPKVATVNGSFDAGIGASYAILADGISAPTTVADLRAVGANEVSRATYGVIVRNSTSDLVMDSIEVVGGAGGAGTAGAAGASATQTPAPSGNPGENSQEVGSVCSTARKAGGASVSGSGAGGQGGSQDTSCTLGVCVGSACNATAGLPGGNGSGFQPGVCGFGGAGGAGVGSGNGGNGTSGANGCVTDGTGGSGGTASNGTISGGFWAPSGGTGAAGSLGLAGTPGGGGGGGGGSDESNDDMGAGGGSGGAAGARATLAGTGGQPGLASIAVYVTNSSAVLNDFQITLGTGGAGGAGGSGGLGQPGGAGGAGGKGLCNNNTGYTGYPFGNCITGGNGGAGGAGGAGGRGGHSGGGGGGAGGPAIGILRHNSAGATITGASFTGGTGGAGGPGGTGPVAGAAGQNGPVTGTVTLP